jgi:chromate transport protein ChrA
LIQNGNGKRSVQMNDNIALAVFALIVAAALVVDFSPPIALIIFVGAAVLLLGIEIWEGIESRVKRKQKRKAKQKL